MDLSHLGDSGTSGALAEWGCVCTHAGEGDGQEGQGHWVWLWPWCGLVHGEGKHGRVLTLTLSCKVRERGSMWREQCVQRHGGHQGPR